MEIYVAQIISKYPALRSSADKLFSIIKKRKDEEITVSFKDVTGISHSFAAEYKFNRSNLKEKIKEIDMNPNVDSMFKTLNKTKTVNKIKPEKIHELHV